jgi:hypothetical protein
VAAEDVGEETPVLDMFSTKCLQLRKVKVIWVVCGMFVYIE